MASGVKSKLQRLTSSASSDDHWKAETEKYRLYVTAGPSYDRKEHRQVLVNTDEATVVENQFLKAKIKVRIRSYRGLPTTSPFHSPYFDDPAHERDQYSIAFSFVPKQDLPSQNTVWGNDFDHPIRERLPPGFNTAFKIVKEFIDPGLGCDAYADEPWLYGPSLSSWFAFRIGDKVDLDAGEDFQAPDEEESAMKEGADGEGASVRQHHNLPETGDRRRKHFLSHANRNAFTFEKGRLYQGDFYNPYIDFGNFALRLPGFSLKVIKYVDQKSHCLRYVFKNTKSGDVYFNVNLHLFWGKELEQAMREDREQREKERQAENGTQEEKMGQNGHGEEPASRKHEVATNLERETPQSKNIPMKSTDNAEPTTKPEQEQNLEAQPEATSEGTSPANMQLHPGDHSASAKVSTNGPVMSEITKMLQKTSTSDQRGGKLNIWQR